MGTISFNEFRVGPWALSDLCFLAAGAAAWAQMLMGNERHLTPRAERRGSSLVLVGTLLMLTGGAISSAQSWAPLSALFVMARLAWLTLVWFWIMRTVCRDRESLWRLCRWWRWSLVISACVALLGQAGIAFATPQHGEGRQAAFTGHPGDLMNFLVAGLPLFLIIVVQRASSRHVTRSALVALAATALIVGGIFATGSMSGLLAGGVSLVAVVAMAWLARSRRNTSRWRSPIVFAVLVLAGVVGIAVLLNSGVPISERLESYRAGGTGVNASVEGRGEVNQYIVSTFDDYLVTGTGMRMPNDATETTADLTTDSTVAAGLRSVHNVPLKMLYEGGLIAFVGLCVVLGAVARQAFRLVFATRGTELYGLALALVGGLTAAYVSSLFGPGTYARHFWLTPMLVGCLWTVRKRELRDERDRRLLELRSEPPDRQAGSGIPL
jgi:hypothetical protein